MYDNSLATRYEAQDQQKCAYQDSFQAWFEKKEAGLEEEFVTNAIKYEGLLDDDCAEYVGDNYDEFLDWAQQQFEKEN